MNITNPFLIVQGLLLQYVYHQAPHLQRMIIIQNNKNISYDYDLFGMVMIYLDGYDL